MTLTDADLAAMEAAIRAAESRTTGELYCVVARECSDYREISLAWAALAALVAPGILLLGGIQVAVPDILDGGGWTAAQVGAAAGLAAREALMGAILLQGVLFAAVWILASIPPVRRFLTPRSVKRARVRRRAQEQFLAKNLHNTRERTGVLIFVSLAEHMAEILADDGIAAKVGPEMWDHAMDALVDGLKRRDPAAGFAAAIGLCGDLLAQHFPADPKDNPNELPDTIVLLP